MHYEPPRQRAPPEGELSAAASTHRRIVGHIGPLFAVVAATSGGAQPVIRAAGAGLATSAILLVVALALPGQLGLWRCHVCWRGDLHPRLVELQAAVIGILAGLLTQGVAVLAVKVFGHDQAASQGLAVLAGWLLAIALTA